MYRTTKTISMLCAFGMAGALLGLISPPHASAEVLVNQRQPFTAVLFDECTGEEIQVTAEDHVLIRRRVAEDGTVYWDERINTHGTAVGLTSGREYVYNETIRFSRPAEPGPECGFAIDFSTRVRLVAEGSYPDLFVRYSLHFEVGPTCEATFDESLESACRG